MNAIRVNSAKNKALATIGCLLSGLFLFFLSASAERPKPKVHGVFEGDTMYSVLPPNAIPAIKGPSFVSGKEADSQMQPNEPVLGVSFQGETKAYSLWQLDAHEIVNDEIASVPIAATW